MVRPSVTNPSDLSEAAQKAGRVLIRVRHLFYICIVAARDVPHIDQGGAALVRDAISSELIPWVLGRVDLLQARVAARGVLHLNQEFRGDVTQLFGV